ncbi:sacsin N-terminal ATP-binding-like domain-containing protein [Geodermatophilus sp. SYSU D00804]
MVHRTAEQVQTTCSFARAERLLGREYHGRFLIELLQNAADAWRNADTTGDRSGVRIVVDSHGPALVVANRGEPFPATVVLDSLGHIGRSTKAQGEAIGHKGIGFKSVLEVSSTPELYSWPLETSLPRSREAQDSRPGPSPSSWRWGRGDVPRCWGADRVLRGAPPRCRYRGAARPGAAAADAAGAAARALAGETRPAAAAHGQIDGAMEQVEASDAEHASALWRDHIRSAACPALGEPAADRSPGAAELGGRRWSRRRRRPDRDRD